MRASKLYYSLHVLINPEFSPLFPNTFYSLFDRFTTHNRIINKINMSGFPVELSIWKYFSLTTQTIGKRYTFWISNKSKITTQTQSYLKSTRYGRDCARIRLAVRFYLLFYETSDIRFLYLYSGFEIISRLYVEYVDKYVVDYDSRCYNNT